MNYEQKLRELHELAEANRPTKIENPNDVVKYVQGKLIGEANEIFLVIGLNARNNIIATKEWQGDIDRAVCYPRQVYKWALENDCRSIILAHNHPSNEVQPSAQDLKLTEIISKGCDTLEINVLDHLIVCNTSEYFSFAEEKMI